MARPESQALAGYFPTPPEILPAIASLVRFHPPEDHRATHLVVDPCAGGGEAIDTLCQLWFPAPPSPAADATSPTPEIFAIEMEAGRYNQLRTRLPHSHHFHADAFRFQISGAEQQGCGASLLFLNPPYDTDKVHSRLEQRFLDRWTSCLAPAAGLLVFLVPYPSLAASADHLACHFDNLRAWRLPAPLFAAFRQCVLVGRRRSFAIPEAELDRRRIERWAADPSHLPELCRHQEPPYSVAVESARLELTETTLDLAGLLAGFRPWADSPLVATDRTVRELIGARSVVALPPRPAHIALALSAGMLNGKRITADRPGLPPLLVKGSLHRRFATLEERFDSHGEKVGDVLVQRPRLTLHILRLDTLEFHELAPGAAPSGAQDLANFNSADLVASYAASLARHMRQQFPALHDPSIPEHAITLPPLGRQPFSRQRELIAAGLKLLTLGENPVAAAEVGTGKTTVALSIAGALWPRHFRATTAELRRVGFDPRRLRPVRRILVVCPPHLLASWSDQAAAVLPDARTVIVSTLSDLSRDAEIYILSRETAKLGPGVRGVGVPRCPRCGGQIQLPPATLATTRARCEHVARLPQDPVARLAERLAAHLLPSHPADPVVRHLLKNHRILRLALDRRRDDGSGTPLTPREPDDLRPHLLALAEIVLDRCLQRTPSRDLESALHRLALAAGLQQEIHNGLHAAAARCHQAVELARARPGQPWTTEVYHQDELCRRLTDLAGRILADRPGHDTNPDDLACLALLAKTGAWIETDPCGEPLFQAVPEPRRYPLAKLILRRHRRRFGLLILDEVHEFSHSGSAQQKAAHRLVALPGVPTIALSGSLMGGYASSLFANFWALSRRFRREFHRTERQAFVGRFGYRKLLQPVGDEPQPQIVGYGATSDREEIRESPAARQLGEAPGVLPDFIIKHLLPIGLVMHKADLDHELPPCRELPVPLDLATADPIAAELHAEHRRLVDLLGRQIRKDLYTPRTGKLWGAMAELPSYPDRATADLPPFVLRYPKADGGEVLAVAKALPAGWRTPKERWILDRLAQHLADGRNVILFLRHTGTSGLPRRYQQLLRLYLGVTPVFLDVTKVDAAEREAWLNANVIRPGCRILITNPRAVQTGLNNLIHFSSAIWAEGVDFDARVVRQANGRIHRIGQTRDVLIEVPYYRATGQETGFHLVARKVSASLQVDGLSIEGALESAGASGDDQEALRAAMSMGQALYASWSATTP
jgi:Uncharacterised methyltransferase family (DUF6094)